MRCPAALLLFPCVLAACGDDRVEYDTPDATVWATHPVLHAPIGDGGVALVTNSGSDTVALLDLGSQSVMGFFPVGVTPLANNGPHHAVIDPVARAFFTPLAFPAPSVLPGPHAAHGSSSTPGIVVKRSLDDMRLLGQVQVEANPGDIVLSPDRTRLYITHFDLLRAEMNAGNRAQQLSNLFVLDPVSMTQVGARIPLCIAAHGETISPDGNTLYAACYGDDALAVVTPLHGDHPTVTVIPVGASLANGSPTYGPYSIAIAPDGATVWMGATPPDPRSVGTGPMYAFDTRTQRFDAARTLQHLPGSPFFPTFSLDGTAMLVPTQNRDTLVRVHLTASPPDTSEVMSYGTDCVLPHAVSRGPDGMYYLVCEGIHTGLHTTPGTVLSLDPRDLHVVTRFAMETYPDVAVFTGSAR